MSPSRSTPSETVGRMELADGAWIFLAFTLFFVITATFQ